MKLKIRYADGNTDQISFKDFCKAHRLTPEAVERPWYVVKSLNVEPWYCHFEEFVEQTDGHFATIFGNGDSPEAALESFKRNLLGGKRLRIQTKGGGMKYAQTPNEWMKDLKL